MIATGGAANAGGREILSAHIGVCIQRRGQHSGRVEGSYYSLCGVGSNVDQVTTHASVAKVPWALPPRRFPICLRVSTSHISVQ